MNSNVAPMRSKTFATWLALLGGSLGLHRFYMFGFGDKLAWLHPVPTLVGFYGVQRMLDLGQDDRLAWMLMPLLGLTLAGSMLQAIVYGLTPDDKWDLRYNAGQASAKSGWLVVIAVVLSLLFGGTALMATIAFTSQRYFESQVDASKELSQ